VSFSGGGYGAGAEEEEDKPGLFSQFKKSLRFIPASKPVKNWGVCVDMYPMMVLQGGSGGWGTIGRIGPGN
jgi:hypothetical protein